MSEYGKVLWEGSTKDGRKFTVVKETGTYMVKINGAIAETGSSVYKDSAINNAKRMIYHIDNGIRDYQ